MSIIKVELSQGRAFLLDEEGRVWRVVVDPTLGYDGPITSLEGSITSRNEIPMLCSPLAERFGGRR